ncbi:hypothetical protein EBR21_04015 [bacterium]|nr:hypothetical protein [bacterium]
MLAEQWTRKLLLGLLACAAISCRGKQSGGFVNGQQTIVTSPDTPIPPSPTTGSFLTGVLLDGSGSALENAKLKIDGSEYESETKNNGALP